MIACISSLASCTEGVVRLLVDDGTELYANEDDFADYYFIKDQLARGRVEVCISGQYVTICDNPWSNVEASVICRQLGFSAYGK